MRFQVAKALGGGFKTWKDLEKLRLKEFIKLWGYAKYGERYQEAMLVRAVGMPWMEKGAREKYLNNLKEDLEAVESETEIKERESLKKNLEDLNRKIMGG